MQKNNVHLLNQPPKPAGMELYYFVFCLEGALTDCTDRLHHIKKEQPDWKAFYDNFQTDTPAPASVVYNLAVRQSMQMIDTHAPLPDSPPVPMVEIITCLPEHYRGLLMRWMRESGFMPPHKIHMRADGDTRPDAEVKLDMIRREFYGKEVQAAFEKNDFCVEVWRSQGVPCFQVAPGAY